nr:MAG TPA: hypothetical protein [Caudoviricetes sp.]
MQRPLRCDNVAVFFIQHSIPYSTPQSFIQHPPFL